VSSTSRLVSMDWNYNGIVEGLAVKVKAADFE
jgi:hypothetical protein